jgi:hypothetical protein
MQQQHAGSSELEACNVRKGGSALTSLSTDHYRYFPIYLDKRSLMIEHLAVASWLAVISQYPTHSSSLNFLIVRVIIVLQDVVWLQM